MATAINTAKLFEDVISWLPDGNTLDDVKVNFLNATVINQVGDDDTKYTEVLCKSLKLCAQINSSNVKVGGSNISEEKIGSLYTKYFQTSSSSSSWDDWLKNDYPNICAILGYSGNTSTPIGIFISPGEAFDLFEDSVLDVSTLYL